MMRLIFIYVCFILKIQLKDENDPLDRFLREISVDNNSTLINKTETADNSNSTKIRESVEDPEADQFIEYLRNISTKQNGSEKQEKDQIKIEESKIEKENTKIDNDTLMKYPELLYIKKLNGSSFRVKVAINQNWSKNLLYPSNIDYALLETNLRKSIDKKFEKSDEYINFHILSYNYFTEHSFICDFILNFKTKDQHLMPLLECFIDEKLGNISISRENLNVYVLEINPSSLDACQSICDDKKCKENQCPSECCKNKTVEGTANSTKIQIEDWTQNSSQIQDDVIKIMNDFSLNDTTSNDHKTMEPNPAVVKAAQFFENPNNMISNQLFDQNLLNPNSYNSELNTNVFSYESPYVNKNLNYGYSGENNYIELNEPDKREKIPSIPSSVNQNYLANVYSSMPNRPLNPVKSPNVYSFYQPVTNQNNYGLKTNLQPENLYKNVRYKVWYPNI